MRTTGAWNFRLFNFPVQVHYSFFLIAILFGLTFNNVILLVLWVAIVFVSILIHELGHAIAAEYYGRSPQIQLYSMGGLTISTRYSLQTYPREILLSFSGPLAGFLLGGLLFLLLRILGPIDNLYLRFIITQLLWVNIGWGIINLIPILPLDGGNIMRNLYHWLRNPYDERTPRIISIGFGIIAFILALVVMRSLFMALLAGWLTFNNYQALRQGYGTDRFL